MRYECYLLLTCDISFPRPAKLCTHLWFSNITLRFVASAKAELEPEAFISQSCIAPFRARHDTAMGAAVTLKIGRKTKIWKDNFFVEIARRARDKSHLYTINA